RESHLRVHAVVFERAVFVSIRRDDALGTQHLRVEQAQRVEIGIRNFAQLEYRANQVAGRKIEEDWPTLGSLLDGTGRRHRNFHRILNIGCHDNGLVFADQHSMRQTAANRMLGQDLAESIAVEIINGAEAVEINRHRECRSLKGSGVLANIGLGNRQRGLNYDAGAKLKPAVESEIERDRSDYRHQDRWNCRHQREHHDDSDMKPRCRLAALTGGVDAMSLPRNQPNQKKDESS